jgi:hypothetical protein
MPFQLHACGCQHNKGHTVLLVLFLFFVGSLLVPPPHLQPWAAALLRTLIPTAAEAPSPLLPGALSAGTSPEVRSTWPSRCCCCCRWCCQRQTKGCLFLKPLHGHLGRLAGYWLMVPHAAGGPRSKPPAAGAAAPPCQHKHTRTNPTQQVPWSEGGACDMVLDAECTMLWGS